MSGVVTKPVVLNSSLVDSDEAGLGPLAKSPPNLKKTCILNTHSPDRAEMERREKRRVRREKNVLPSTGPPHQIPVSFAYLTIGHTLFRKWLSANTASICHPEILGF